MILVSKLRFDNRADIPARGMTGAISYNRLIELFRETGEIQPNETVTRLTFLDNQIQYTVETKP